MCNETWYLDGHVCWTCSMMCFIAPVFGCCGSNQGVCAELWWITECPCRVGPCVATTALGVVMDVACYTYYCCYMDACQPFRKSCFDCEPFVPAGAAAAIVSGLAVRTSMPVTIQKLLYHQCCVYDDRTVVERCKFLAPPNPTSVARAARVSPDVARIARVSLGSVPLPPSIVTSRPHEPTKPATMVANRP